jgi:hypothetical protein
VNTGTQRIAACRGLNRGASAGTGTGTGDSPRWGRRRKHADADANPDEDEGEDEDKDKERASVFGQRVRVGVIVSRDVHGQPGAKLGPQLVKRVFAPIERA